MACTGKIYAARWSEAGRPARGGPSAQAGSTSASTATFTVASASVRSDLSAHSAWARDTLVIDQKRPRATDIAGGRQRRIKLRCGDQARCLSLIENEPPAS